MTLDLFLYRPATIMALSISFMSASVRASGVKVNFFERFSKALMVFMSAVFWESTVLISALKGSLARPVIRGTEKLFSSVRRIFSARSLVILYSPSGNTNIQ